MLRKLKYESYFARLAYLSSEKKDSTYDILESIQEKMKPTDSEIPYLLEKLIKLVGKKNVNNAIVLNYIMFYSTNDSLCGSIESHCLSFVIENAAKYDYLPTLFSLGKSLHNYQRLITKEMINQNHSLSKFCDEDIEYYQHTGWYIFDSIISMENEQRKLRLLSKFLGHVDCCSNKNFDIKTVKCYFSEEIDVLKNILNNDVTQIVKNYFFSVNFYDLKDNVRHIDCCRLKRIQEWCLH